MQDRRSVMAMMAGAAAIAPATARAAMADAPLLPPDFAGAQRALAAMYDVDRAITGFDAGYYGVMPRSTAAAYAENTRWMNRNNALFLRSALPGETRDERLDHGRDAVAGLLGCARDEIALCGGATEGLYALIANYRGLQPGDAVIYGDVDYDEMQFAMDYLRESRGAHIIRFDMPEPATAANVLAAYDRLLRDTPRAKLLLLTHISNRAGLVPPVREIIAMAKARGVDVILDCAHAIGVIDFKVADIGADFIGFSLHKWISAPLGTGGIYIRRDRLKDIAPWLGNRIHDADDVRARVPTGTVDYAARLTIPDAVALHDRIGTARKHDHLLALRNHWVDRARTIPGVQIVTPDEPGRYVAISAFRMPGQKTVADAQRVQKLFVEKHKLLVVAKAGLASGPVLRVTPTLYTSTQDLDRLIAAIHAERGMFG